jgi:hypothetical protein
MIAEITVSAAVSGASSAGGLPSGALIVVGWGMGETLRTALVVDAFNMAV